MSKILRTGIIGCGGFAATHARLLAGVEEVKLVAFCNHNLAKAEDFSHQFAGGHGQVYEDHHEMFDQEDLDLVYIVLPPFAHSDQVIEAASHGVHVFIEKPIALTSEQGWRMVKAVEAAGVKSQVGFLWRFGEATEYLKNALDTGDAGPPSMMLARYYANSLHSWWWRDLQEGEKNRPGTGRVERSGGPAAPGDRTAAASSLSRTTPGLVSLASSKASTGSAQSLSTTGRLVACNWHS